MAKKATKNIEMAESVNAFVSGLGEGRLRVVQELNQGNQVAMELVPNASTGKVDAFIAENKKKVGSVMPADDRTFETLKSREPATNTLIDSTELIKLIGNKTIPATAITATSVSIIKIRIDSAYLQNEPVETVAAATVEPEVELDLSSFSPEDAAEVQKRIDYIRTKCTFSYKVRKNIEAAYVDFMKSHKNIVPFKVTYINNSRAMDTMITKVLGHRHIALDGPKGVGKNQAVTQIANFFDLQLCDMTMSRGIERGDIIGERTFNDDGKIAVELSNMLSCLVNGGLACCDEVNLADPATLGALNSLLDDRGYIEVPGYGKVNLHPQSIVIVTMNKSSIEEEYAGTNDMNAAFMDRFHKIHLKADPSMMKDIFILKANLDEAAADKLAGYYKLFYNSVYNADADSCIPSTYLSQRSFIEAAKEYAKGWEDDIESAFRHNVLETIDDDEVRGIIENLILVC